jgi:hypothetical protein
MPLQRTTIHPDTHRTAMIAGGANDLAHTLLIANIAGVDPQAGSASFGRLNPAPVMKMDVGDNRHRALLADFMQGLCAVLVGAGYAHNVRTCLSRGVNLRQRGLYIGGQTIGHCLH